jgi:hypothetical protein
MTLGTFSTYLTAPGNIETVETCSSLSKSDLHAAEYGTYKCMEDNFHDQVWSL